MDELKQALFEEALYHKRQYQRCRKILGEFDFITLTHEEKHMTLYGIIVEGDCENEFLDWEQEMQQGG